MSTFSTYRDGVYEHRKKTITANSPTTTLDLSDASMFEIDLAADTTLVLNNPLKSIYTIIINQTNNFEVSWPINVYFENAIPLILPNGPAWSLKCTVIYDGTDFYVLDCENIRYADALLLDAYPGAAAAYSLRQLRTGVTNVVRVRRDTTPSAEEDFTAEEITDGTLLAFVGAGNDGFVVTWYDQSGNGNDATQSTAASQAKIVDSGVLVEENGKPAVDFDGVDDHLLNATMTANSTQSVFYVKRGIIRAGNSSVLGFPTAISSTQIGIYYWDTINYEYGFNTWNSDSWGIESATSLYTKQTVEFALFKDGNPTTSGVKLFIDSVEQSLSQVKNISVSRTMANGFRIATGGSSYSSQDYDGTIQEIIIYPSDQSSNRVSIEDSINDHYNIY